MLKKRGFAWVPLEDFTFVVVEKHEFKNLDAIFQARCSGIRSKKKTFALRDQCTARGKSFPENKEIGVSPETSVYHGFEKNLFFLKKKIVKTDWFWTFYGKNMSKNIVFDKLECHCYCNVKSDVLAVSLHPRYRTKNLQNGQMAKDANLQDCFLKILLKNVLTQNTGKNLEALCHLIRGKWQPLDKKAPKITIYDQNVKTSPKVRLSRSIAGKT